MCYNVDIMTVLNHLVTNQYLVRLSHALSEGLNKLTGLSSVTRHRREKNCAALARYSDRAYINGQGRGEVSRLPFGKFTMDYNGCEVIACYNALRVLGRERPLGEVAAYFERRGIFLAGRWGTHAAELPRYFERLGLHIHTLYASSVRDPAEYDAAFAGAKTAVFSFWNDAKRLRSGVHTVALAHSPAGLVIFNLYNSDFAPNTSYRSVSDFVARSGALPILLVTLNE